MIRAARSLVAAVTLCALLTGCVRLPTSGPVSAVDRGPETTAPLAFIAPGPVPGDNPEQIVTAFLKSVADTSSEHDFAKARQFLTRDVRDVWNPDNETVVYTDNSVSLEQAAMGDSGTDEPDIVRVTVSVEEVGQIDSRGVYEAAGPSADDQLAMELRKEFGQWRISSIPDRVFVAESYMSWVFDTYNLYFLDPKGTALVPDGRWFPRRASVATTLARELLRGPSPVLVDAVRSSVPDGTQLAAPGAVRMVGNVAQVDLSVTARSADPALRALMYAQIKSTLLQITDVADVRISAGGADLDAPASTVVKTVGPPQGALIGLRDGGLVRVAGGGDAAEIRGMPGLAERAPLALGVPQSGAQPDWVAVLPEARDAIVRAQPGADGEATILTGKALTPPSVDRLEWVWSTEDAPGGRVIAAHPTGASVELKPTWSASESPRQIRISPDGTRAAVVLVGPDDRWRLVLVGIVRGSAGVPVTFVGSTSATLVARATDIKDVGWMASDRLAVLAKRPGAGLSGRQEVQREVFAVDVSGRTEPSLPTVAQATNIATGASLPSLVVYSASRGVLRRAGLAWETVPGTQGVQLPTYPG